MYDDDASTAETASEQGESGSASPVEKSAAADSEGTKNSVSAEVVAVAVDKGEAFAASHAQLKSVFRRAAWYSLALTVAVAILGEFLPSTAKKARKLHSWQFRSRCFSRTMSSARRSTRSGFRARCE